MKEALELKRVGFDNYENRNGRLEVVVGLFDDQDGEVAHYRLGKWLEAHKPEPYYLGWDGQVYPQWIVTKRYVNPETVKPPPVSPLPPR